MLRVPDHHRQSLLTDHRFVVESQRHSACCCSTSSICSSIYCQLASHWKQVFELWSSLKRSLETVKSNQLGIRGLVLAGQARQNERRPDPNLNQWHRLCLSEIRSSLAIPERYTRRARWSWSKCRQASRHQDSPTGLNDGTSARQVPSFPAPRTSVNSVIQQDITHKNLYEKKQICTHSVAAESMQFVFAPSLFPYVCLPDTD